MNMECNSEILGRFFGTLLCVVGVLFLAGAVIVFHYSFGNENIPGNEILNELAWELAKMRMFFGLLFVSVGLALRILANISDRLQEERMPKDLFGRVGQNTHHQLR